MRTTIELPDETLTRAKALSVTSGVSLRQFFIEAIEQKLTTVMREGGFTMNGTAATSKKSALVGRETESSTQSNADHSGAQTWHDFFELMKSIDVPGDFMSERPMNVPPVDRELFKG